MSRYKIVKVFNTADQWSYAVVDSKMHRLHSTWVFLSTAKEVAADLNRWVERLAA